MKKINNELDQIKFKGNKNIKQSNNNNQKRY